LDKIKKHLREYSSFSCWLFSDLYKLYKFRLAWFVFLTFSGLSLQTFVVYLCYRYASSLENNEIFTWLHWEFVPRTSFFLLLTVAALIMVLKIVSATILLNGKKAGLKLARDYTDYCSTRIYVLVSSASKIIDKIDAETINSRLIAKMARKNSLYAGLVVRVLTFSVLNFGTALVAGTALFLIDVTLTLIVLIVLGIAAYFFYRKSIKAAGVRATMGILGAKMSLEHRHLNDRLSYSPGKLNYSSIEINEVFKKGVSAEFSKAYVNQRLVLEESNVIAQIVIGVAIFLIIMVQGNATIQQESNWSALLIYLVAFNYFGTGFAKAAQQLISVNRFYPSLNSYSKFVLSLNKKLVLEKSHADKKCENLTILVDSKKEYVELNEGEIIAYISSGIINNYELSIFLKSMRFQDEDIKKAYSKKTWLISPKFSLLKTSIKEAFSLPQSVNTSEIYSDIVLLDDNAEISNLPSNIDKVIYQKDMDNIKPELLTLLLVVIARRHADELIVIDEAALKPLSEKVIKNIFEFLNKNIIVVAYASSNLVSLGHYGEVKSFFSDSGSIIGYLNIEKTDKNEIKKYADRVNLSTKAKGKGSELIDDELDEEF